MTQEAAASCNDCRRAIVVKLSEDPSHWAWEIETVHLAFGEDRWTGGVPRADVVDIQRVTVNYVAEMHPTYQRAWLEGRIERNLQCWAAEHAHGDSDPVDQATGRA